MDNNSEPLNLVEVGRGVFDVEIQSLLEVQERLGSSFAGAVKALAAQSGRIVLCGMGKSGHIARKISATLASTGTPSFYMHPAEAFHGDLGMLQSNDALILISQSGETEEIVRLIPYVSDNGNLIIAMTGNVDSTLARAAHHALNVNVRTEACPLRLAPTSSTTACLVMGDALAISLMRIADFQEEGFARFHPGGSLGKRLLSKVEHEMSPLPLPFVRGDDVLLTVLHRVSESKVGLALVGDPDKLEGIITDGDIRRAVEKYREKAFDLLAEDMMSREPLTVAAGARTSDAIQLMDRRMVTALIVQDGGRPVGILRK